MEAVIVPDTLTRGQRFAVLITEVTGDWPFIILQAILLAMWIAVNVSHWCFHFDPYPFQLLNLALSFQAAFTGPIVLMAQNVAVVRDRILMDTIRADVATIRTETHQTLTDVHQLVTEIHAVLHTTTF